MVKEAFNKDRLVFYEQLWALLDGLRIGVFTVDSKRRITSFNRAAEILTGYREEDVVGKLCHQVFLNDLCFGDCKYHEAVEAERKSLSFEVEIIDAHKEKRTITKVVTPLYDTNGAFAPGAVKADRTRLYVINPQSKNIVVFEVQ